MGAVDQAAAQAAVWHYNNDLSWEYLASKRIRERVDTPTTVQYFSPQQIMHAMNLGKKVESLVAKEKMAMQKKENAQRSYADDLN